MEGGIIAWPAGGEKTPARVFFTRPELDRLLALYGRMVAAGEWRDYAMAGGIDSALFAVHRRTAESPLYRIEKRPALARRQGAWALIESGGRVLKRGHSLDAILAPLERKLLKIIRE